MTVESISINMKCLLKINYIAKKYLLTDCTFVGVRVIVMVFNATFNHISVNCGGQVYWWMKPEKPTDLPHVTDKLYHINVVLSTPRLSGIRTYNVSDDRH
jgi:hypothetical protein